MESVAGRVEDSRGSARIRCTDAFVDAFDYEDPAEWKPVQAKLALQSAIMQACDPFQERMPGSTFLSATKQPRSPFETPCTLVCAMPTCEAHDCVYRRAAVREMHGCRKHVLCNYSWRVAANLCILCQNGSVWNRRIALLSLFPCQASLS